MFLVGNQLPILLISFIALQRALNNGWESVTNPLDKLSHTRNPVYSWLGISYQSS